MLNSADYEAYLGHSGFSSHYIELDCDVHL